MNLSTNIIPEEQKEFFQNKFLKWTKEMLQITADPSPHDQETHQKDLEEIRRVQETTREFFTKTKGDCILITRGQKNALVGEIDSNQLLALKWKDHGGGLLTNIELENPKLQKDNTPLKIWGPKNLKLSYKGEITQRKNKEKETLSEYN